MSEVFIDEIDEFDEFDPSVNTSQYLDDDSVSAVHEYCFNGDIDMYELGIHIEDDDAWFKE